MRLGRAPDAIPRPGIQDRTPHIPHRSPIYRCYTAITGYIWCRVRDILPQVHSHCGSRSRSAPSIRVGTRAPTRKPPTDFGDNSDGNPWGTASFDSEFVSSQPYDVAVALDLPRTPSNLDVGNFMIDLTLYSRQTASVLPTSTDTLNPISQSRRPAILTYNSRLVDLARRIVRLPLYVVGWRREAEILEVPMMEKVEFARGARNLPQSLRIEIQSDGKMQIYSARVEFRARFTGLRWVLSSTI